MGYYIQTPGRSQNKALTIAYVYDGQVIPQPSTFAQIPPDKALVIVVDNAPFEAAALADDEREFSEFTDPSDRRPKQYVLLDKPTAYQLAGYKDPAMV